ncbi:hypothetical protein KVT40_004010 [Elsinoe batatas]|uniref:Nephrocystin 3-like N-terminal domain-containing protein n=1 Tax=Elsinoe batatas TaxID=2601811 RepID=A0A8K0L356_9PEZI|nr:hypothetical protein KVT40_004010 [Elsinoe batatas]
MDSQRTDRRPQPSTTVHNHAPVPLQAVNQHNNGPVNASTRNTQIVNLPISTSLHPHLYDQQTPDDNRDIEKCMIKRLSDRLEFPELDSRFQSIRAASKDTCQWLTKNEKIKTWLATSGTSWLSIASHAGTGKSTMMRFTQEMLEEKETSHIVVGFYMNARKAEPGHRALLSFIDRIEPPTYQQWIEIACRERNPAILSDLVYHRNAEAKMQDEEYELLPPLAFLLPLPTRSEDAQIAQLLQTHFKFMDYAMELD